MKFLKLKQIGDVFIDGLLTDQNRLLFLSCWASDTRAQEFIAKLSLQSTEEGFLGGTITVERPDGTVLPANVPSDAKLDKEYGSMPSTALFGSRMSHVMVFDQLVGSVDKANRRAIAIRRSDGGDDDVEDRLWRLVNDVSTVPLLDHWRDSIMAWFREEGWLYDIPGVGVQGVMLNLSDAALEPWITANLKSGVLSVPQHTELKSA